MKYAYITGIICRAGTRRQVADDRIGDGRQRRLGVWAQAGPRVTALTRNGPPADIESGLLRKVIG